MGLSWISPLYLSGALLLALPVILHLVQRQSQGGIKFPSLMFLKKIQYREKRRLKIRNWWLLILRCLLLLLIVLAFARPFLSGQTGGPGLNSERTDSIIVIDRSASMRMSNHWQQAQEIALSLVDEKKASDRIGLVIFDDRAEVLSELDTNPGRLRRLIQRLSPGLRTTHLRAATEQAARLLAASDASRKHILLISDFQASAASSGTVPKISKDIELTTLPVTITDEPNATISSFSIKPSSTELRDEFSLGVKIANNSSTTQNQQMKLEVNGRELDRRDLQLDAGMVVQESFDNLNPGGNLIRGVVSLTDDALLLDNRAFFVHSNKQQVPVLILEGSRSRVNQSVYLENALSLSRKPVFHVKRMSANQLKPEDLSSWAVIIINDAPIPGGVLGEALSNFVAAGGGLLIATGDAVQGNWPSGDGGFLAGTLLPRVVSKQGMAHNIKQIDSNHPLSELPGGEAGTDLSMARIFAYRKLRANADDRVLARYTDDGIALLERQVGRGRVMVLTTTLDTHWNDFSLQPIFLPFLHHVLRYLAAFEPYSSSYDVGTVVDVMRYARALTGGDAIVAATDDSTLIVESPSAREIHLDRQSPLLTLDEQGFYQVHRATTAGSEVVLAANINPVEANLEPLDLERYVEEIMTSAQPVSSGSALTRPQAGEVEQQQQIWYLILSVVLVILLVEAFYANWICAKTSAKT